MVIGSPDPDRVTVTANSKNIVGWTSVRIERGIDHMSSHFDLSLTEEIMTGREVPPLKPFDPVVVMLGNDVILTGYADAYNVSISPREHSIRVTGRSKTEDLIDCTPDVPSGAYNGYNLAQIAAAMCNVFNVQLVVETDVGDAFPDATIERHETVFRYLERLCRLRAVLACDDELGRLVLTQAGSSRGADVVVPGNVMAGSFKLDASKRFSIYKVKSQLGENNAGLTNGFEDEDNVVPQVEVQCDIQAQAIDPAVPRYRPHVTIAESALSLKDAGVRADWQMRYAIGRGTRARVKLDGWRQPNGQLWKINTLVSTDIPYFHVSADLLIAGVTFTLDENGRQTELLLGPIDAYTPNPGEVLSRKQRRKGGSPISLQGFDEQAEE